MQSEFILEGLGGWNALGETTILKSVNNRISVVSEMSVVEQDDSIAFQNHVHARNKSQDETEIASNAQVITS